jgi:hypothetical protein
VLSERPFHDDNQIEVKVEVQQKSLSCGFNLDLNLSLLTCISLQSVESCRG